MMGATGDELPALFSGRVAGGVPVSREEAGVRARRVGNAMREKLTSLLARDVQDPVLSGLVITDVSLSDDLGIVWVKARLLVGGEDQRRRKEVVRHLVRAGGRLRRGLGRDLRMKRVPELRFEYDTGVDAAERVDALLDEIAAEKKEKQK